MTGQPVWIEFDALVELLPWGRNVYTILRVPQALVAAAQSFETRRVEGSIEGVQVNVGVNRADVLPDSFMYVGKGMQRRIGAGPGDVVRCRLRPADPDDVPLADDVHLALADAGRLDDFRRRTPAQQRRLLQPIDDAVRPATRQQRTAALIRHLMPS